MCMCLVAFGDSLKALLAEQGLLLKTLLRVV